jgi:hypothetical protein
MNRRNFQKWSEIDGVDLQLCKKGSKSGEKKKTKERNSQCIRGRHQNKL